MKEYLYTNSKDGRSRMVIVDDSGHITSKSYPRILMEKKLGRPLEPNEDVHHIDGNKSNNDISNLEIIMHGEHQKMHMPSKYSDTIQKCWVCGKEFVYTAKQMQSFLSDKKYRPNKRRAITCSRHCAYLFGTQEQFKGNFEAECRLNGELFPNENTVPNDTNHHVRREYTPTIQNG